MSRGWEILIKSGLFLGGNMLRVLTLATGFLCAAIALAQEPKSQPAKPDLEKAKGIASQVCAACHGADGNSVAPANPKIAGQFPEYLHKQLGDFKPQAGKKAARENAVMSGMVANLSDGDMK